MMRSFLVFAVCVFVFTTRTTAASDDYLQKCFEKQVASLRGQYVSLGYKEEKNSAYHSPEPWQVMHFSCRGIVQCNAEEFFQCDTVQGKASPLISKTQLSKGELLLQMYWRRELIPTTKKMITEQTFETARYSPVLLLNYFYNNKPALSSESNSAYAVYQLPISKAIVKLFIRTSDCLLEKVTTTEHHDVLGDRTSTLTYGDFAQSGELHYPQNIGFERPPNIHDEVKITAAVFAKSATPLLERPANYSIAEDNEPAEQPPVVTKIANRIYTVDIPQAEAQAGIVEFDSFLVVIDAPLSSKNGELIIQEAQKIAPHKPIKYFVFGHHHDWYVGGLRAFVHKGITVLCTKGDSAYVQFIADAPHTMQPDSLHLQPRPLRMEILDSSRTITEGDFQMQAYVLGKKSGHTNDYTLFYFPTEKIVFEGDLAWIVKNMSALPASKTQVALYNAIKDLGWEVETIVQTWPTGEKYKVKTVFPFKDLEASINAKPLAE